MIGYHALLWYLVAEIVGEAVVVGIDVCGRGIAICFIYIPIAPCSV